MKRLILDFEDCNCGCHFYSHEKCFHPKLPSPQILVRKHDLFDSRMSIPHWCLLEDTPAEERAKITTVDEAFEADRKRQEKGSIS